MSVPTLSNGEVNINIPQNDTQTYFVNHPIIQNNQSQSLKKIESNQHKQSNSVNNSFEHIIKVETQTLFVRNSFESLSSQKLLSPVKQQNEIEEGVLTLKRPHTMVQGAMVQGEKRYEMSSQTIKHKLPLTILNFIMQNAKSLNSSNKSAIMTKAGKKISEFGISRKLKQKYNTKLCKICEVELPKKQFIRISRNCQHKYCRSCLHQYVIYKIQSFEAVECPYEQCHNKLDQSSILYAELPLDVRKKYQKLLQYEMVREFPNRKLCPKQKCEGWIDLTPEIDTICTKCKTKYCSKCFFTYHEGECENRQLEFFQETLRYRQCNKCKNIIQKSLGCNHMTCRCKYQFCYLCGERWASSHICKDKSGEPVPQERNQCCCCEIQACNCDCCDVLGNHCEDCCDGCVDLFCNCDNCCEANEMECECLRCVLHTLRRIVVLILFITIVAPLFILFTLTLGTYWFIITIFCGISLYTCQIISGLDGVSYCLAIIFYPITMFFGIFIAFGEIFCQSYGGTIAEIGHEICETFLNFLS